MTTATDEVRDIPARPKDTGLASLLTWEVYPPVPKGLGISEVVGTAIDSVGPTLLGSTLHPWFVQGAANAAVRNPAAEVRGRNGQLEGLVCTDAFSEYAGRQAEATLFGANLNSPKQLVHQKGHVA